MIYCDRLMIFTTMDSVRLFGWVAVHNSLLFIDNNVFDGNSIITGENVRLNDSIDAHEKVKPLDSIALQDVC